MILLIFNIIHNGPVIAEMIEMRIIADDGWH